MSGALRVLVLGAAGQVGRELQRSIAGMGEVVALDRGAANLAEPEQLREVVRGVAPDVILNAAAYTAVDRAETERELAFAVNAEAPRVLAEEARRQGALLVHYSTDYVFDGSKAGSWVESDATGPLNVYGASKLAGEQGIAAVGGRYLIFRTSWVYGPEGKNFLLTMLRLGRERDRLRVVDDQFGAPTTSMEIADATRSVVETVLSGELGASDTWSGVYHLSCAGSTTWCGFARAIFACGGDLLGGCRPEVEAIGTVEYPTPARRPLNSVMSSEALFGRFGVRLPGWEAALDRVLEVLRNDGQVGGRKS